MHVNNTNTTQHYNTNTTLHGTCCTRHEKLGATRLQVVGTRPSHRHNSTAQQHVLQGATAPHRVGSCATLDTTVQGTGSNKTLQPITEECKRTAHRATRKDRCVRRGERTHVTMLARQTLKKREGTPSKRRHTFKKDKAHVTTRPSTHVETVKAPPDGTCWHFRRCRTAEGQWRSAL